MKVTATTKHALKDRRFKRDNNAIIAEYRLAFNRGAQEMAALITKLHVRIDELELQLHRPNKSLLEDGK